MNIKKIHLAKLLTITCATVLIFTFSPISTSCSKVKKPVPPPPELNFIPQHEGNQDLSKEDDVTEYNIEIENGSFSDYTGTYCQCSDADFLQTKEYVSRQSPPDPETDSFLFLNNLEDISQGAYVKMHLLKDYREQGAYYDLHTTLHITFHDDTGRKPDLTGDLQITFYNSIGGFNYDDATDSVIDFTTSNMSSITKDSSLTDIVTTMQSANIQEIGSITYSDD
jgi:hypothetical protein